jgi:hypothetical protein
VPPCSSLSAHLHALDGLLQADRLDEETPSEMAGRHRVKTAHPQDSASGARLRAADADQAERLHVEQLTRRLRRTVSAQDTGQDTEHERALEGCTDNRIERRRYPMQQNRPLAITIVCIIGFLAFGLSLFTVPSLYGALTVIHTAASTRCQLRRHHTHAVAPDSRLSPLRVWWVLMARQASAWR